MANKWLRKLGIGMSMITTVSQVSGMMVLAAPEDGSETEDAEVEEVLPDDTDLSDATEEPFAEETGEYDESERVETVEDSELPTDIQWEAPGIFSFIVNSDKPLEYTGEVYYDGEFVAATGLGSDLGEYYGKRYESPIFSYPFQESGTYTLLVYVQETDDPEAEEIYADEEAEIEWTMPEESIEIPENLHWEKRSEEEFAVAVCDPVSHAFRYQFNLYKDEECVVQQAPTEAECDFSEYITDPSEHEYFLTVTVWSDDLTAFANSPESDGSEALTVEGEPGKEDVEEDTDWQKDYVYTISEDVLVISGYKGTDKELKIPAEAMIEGKKYAVEVDSLDPEKEATARDAFVKITFDKGVVFGDGMTFRGMKSLEELTLSGVDTGKMTSMNSMFNGCSKITKLDLSSFDTSKVMGMASMFAGCEALTDVDLTSFSTENVCDARGMFKDCSSLKTLDLSHFDLKNAVIKSLLGHQAAYAEYSGTSSMFDGSGIQTLCTPKNIPAEYVKQSGAGSEKQMEENKQLILSDKTVFADQKSGEEYTCLPYGKDSEVSHTLVRKDTTTPEEPEDGTNTNTFKKETAEKGVKVIDAQHTLKLETDESGKFVSAKILGADGKVDASVNSYIANVVQEYDENGNPKEFYSLAFRNGVWDTTYDTSKDGLYTYQGEQYSIAGGVVNLNANGLTYTGDADGWRFVNMGRVVKDHAGLVAYGPEDNLQWFWINDEGCCDNEYAAIVSWNGGQFLVHGGRLRTDYTGFTYDPQDTEVWYHITNGQVWGDGVITDQSIEGGVITRSVTNGRVNEEIVIDPDLVAESSTNLHQHNYSRWTSVTKSYLFADGDTIVRVEALSDHIVIERYSKDHVLLKQQQLSYELPLFGGFYHGKDANYVMFGQANEEESEDKEVIRIVKYNRSWERIGSVSISPQSCDDGTKTPFAYGASAFAESGDLLVVHTTHQMITSEDGLNHQKNRTLLIDTKTMTNLSDQYGNFSGFWAGHSFNQFVCVDDHDVIVADHGDAYPRAIVLHKWEEMTGKKPGSIQTYNVLEIPGSIGDNTTKATLGGFGVSDTHYIAAASHVNYDDDFKNNNVYNIALLLQPKSDDGTGAREIMYTFAEEGDSTSYCNPFLVKIDSGLFVMMWELYDANAKTYLNRYQAVAIDGAGNALTEVLECDGTLSDCQPIYQDGKILWYSTEGGVPNFDEIAVTVSGGSVQLSHN